LPVVANYTVTDEHGATATSTLTITVTGTNDAPTVSNLVVAEGSIAFTATDIDDGASLHLAAPFAAAFGNPTLTSGATTTLTPAVQAAAVSGTLQVTDGIATADVTGLYLGSGGNDTATAPLAGSPNAMYGFGGNDALTGGSAADKIFGGTGDDTI